MNQEELEDAIVEATGEAVRYGMNDAIEVIINAIRDACKEHGIEEGTDAYEEVRSQTFLDIADNI